MPSMPVTLEAPSRRHQTADLKDDRLSPNQTAGDLDGIEINLDELASLTELVGSRVSTGAVEISEIVMCAKCVGECKIF